MGPSLRFFHPKNYNEIKDLSSDLSNISFKQGLHGDDSGTLTVEATDSNRSFLSGLSGYSAFVKFGFDSDTYQGLVESCVYDEKGQYTIEVTGFLGMLDIIAARGSNHSEVLGSSKSIPEADKSFTKVFYADSAAGMLWSLLKNLEELMNARGYNIFWDYGNIPSKITSSPSFEWGQTYRINSQENATYRRCIEDLLNTKELTKLSVTGDNSGTFSWHLNILDNLETVKITEATDQIGEIEIQKDGKKTYKYAAAAGSDTAGNKTISEIDTGADSVFSTLICDSPADDSDAISQINLENLQKTSAQIGQLTFATYSDELNVLDYVEIDINVRDNITGIVIEKSVEGQKVSYTLQLVDGPDGVFLSRSTGLIRKLVFDPLSYSTQMAKRQAFLSRGTTGRRS